MKIISILSGVYLIKHNPTGQTYVGSSFNIHHRFEQHMQGITKWFKESNRKDYTLYLLEECGSEDLKLREQYYLDSLLPSLNKNSSSSSPPIHIGEDNSKALYSRGKYESIFLELSSGASVSATATRLHVTLDVVKGIYSLNSHKYLHEAFPDEFHNLVNLKARRSKTLPIKIYHEEHGEFELYRPFSVFCEKFNIPNNGNVGRLYSGSRKSYLGWKVKE